jgi:hypothetical protein
VYTVPGSIGQSLQSLNASNYAVLYVVFALLGLSFFHLSLPFPSASVSLRRLSKGGDVDGRMTPFVHVV